MNRYFKIQILASKREQEIFLSAPQLKEINGDANPHQRYVTTRTTKEVRVGTDCHINEMVVPNIKEEYMANFATSSKLKWVEVIPSNPLVELLDSEVSLPVIEFDNTEITVGTYVVEVHTGIKGWYLTGVRPYKGSAVQVEIQLHAKFPKYFDSGVSFPYHDIGFSNKQSWEVLTDLGDVFQECLLSILEENQMDDRYKFK